MIGTLIARIFPNYSSRAWLKECLQYERDEKEKMKQQLKEARLEVIKWNTLADERSNEIKYLHGLAESLSEKIFELKAERRAAESI